MNRYGFPPGEHAKALQNNLATQAPDVQFVEAVTASGDTPAHRSLSLDPRNEDSYSEHFVLLCDEEGGAFLAPPATSENPAWLGELQRLYSSCKAARTFGPNVKEVQYTMACGSALHLRKPIPKLLATAEKKARERIDRERKERDKETRVALLQQCGPAHVVSCEKKGCHPTPPPPERHCPGGRNLSDEERRKQVEARKLTLPKPTCGCVCGLVAAQPQPACPRVP
jgi:hypothetical protein